MRLMFKRVTVRHKDWCQERTYHEAVFILISST
jgi:hypothetical protein